MLWRNKRRYQKIVSDLAEKIQKDPKLLKQFREDPIKAVEGLTGVDLPDDMIRQVAELVKARIDLNKAGDLLGGLFSRK